MTTAAAQNKTVPQATIGGEPGGRGAIVVDDVQEPVASEANTAVPSGIVAEPGRDVFAKDDKDSAKSAASIGSEPNDAVLSDADAERVVSVVGAEVSGAPEVEHGTDMPADVGDPVAAELEGGEAETGAAASRRPEGPMDHEAAIADQVAHELYPEADTGGGAAQRRARDA